MWGDAVVQQPSCPIGYHAVAPPSCGGAGSVWIGRCAPLLVVLLKRQIGFVSRSPDQCEVPQRDWCGSRQAPENFEYLWMVYRGFKPCVITKAHLSRTERTWMWRGGLGEAQ